MVKYLLIALFFTGCTNTHICPPFPKPTKEILQPIESLNNKDVDKWMEELFKLNLKLKECSNSY